MNCRCMTTQILRALKEQKRKYGTIDRISPDLRNAGDAHATPTAYIHCRYCRQGGHGGTISIEVHEEDKLNFCGVLVKRFLAGKNLGKRRDYITSTNETPDKTIKKAMEFIYEGFLILHAGMYNLPEAAEIRAAMDQNIPSYRLEEGDVIPW